MARKSAAVTAVMCRELSARMDQLRSDLAKLRLFETMHAIGEAQQRLGYEVAEHIEKERR